MLRAATANAFIGIEIDFEKNHIKITEKLNTATVRYILRLVVAVIPSKTLSYSIPVITTALELFNFVNATDWRITVFPVSFFPVYPDRMLKSLLNILFIIPAVLLINGFTFAHVAAKKSVFIALMPLSKNLKFGFNYLLFA